MAGRGPCGKATGAAWATGSGALGTRTASWGGCCGGRSAAATGASRLCRPAPRAWGSAASWGCAAGAGCGSGALLLHWQASEEN